MSIDTTIARLRELAIGHDDDAIRVTLSASALRIIADAADHIAALTAAQEEAARSRAIIEKRHVEVLAMLDQATAERDALREAICSHNSDCEQRCRDRSSAKLCATYNRMGRLCPDCPRDEMIETPGAQS